MQAGAQLWVFGQSILLGLTAGLLYDLLRPFRIRAPRVTGLLDALYCLLVGSGCFLFLLRRTQGQIRGFMLLGFFGGLVLFFCAFSQFLRPLWSFWADTLAFLACPWPPDAGSAKKFAVLEKMSFIFGADVIQ